MNIRVLCIGDVVGIAGRVMFQKHIGQLREKYAIDLVMVNGENSADDGRGVTGKIAEFFRHNKADVITTGNHVWAKRDVVSYITEHKNFLLRPANFPSEVPGVGVTIVHARNIPVAFVNLQGRVFMKEHVDCPFKAAQSLMCFLKDNVKVIIIDFHAETTAEKAGIAYYLDGKVSAVVGTHTHVQTADERILPQGTAFMTDLGMVGALNSMLGMKKEPIIQHFITQMPTRFNVETEGPIILNGAVIEIDSTTGKAVRIERVRIQDNNIRIEASED